MPQFKEIYAEQMLTDADGRPRFADRPRGQARDTAYAVRLDPDVLLVTVDVFERRGGDVHMSVDAAQLRWLRRVLRQARKDDVAWVMVQGHVPMTGDVRTRNSSHLVYEKGVRSPFWRTMVEGGVDVYLSGEVHDQTVHQRDGILEVSHGSLLYRGEASYVVGRRARSASCWRTTSSAARSASTTGSGRPRARERRATSAIPTTRSSPAPWSPAAPAPAACASTRRRACSGRDADPGAPALTR